VGGSFDFEHCLVLYFGGGGAGGGGNSRGIKITSLWRGAIQSVVQSSDLRDDRTSVSVWKLLGFYES
jgi:hypothetical protein